MENTMDREELQVDKKLVKKEKLKKNLIYTIIIVFLLAMTAVCALIYGQNIAKQAVADEIQLLRDEIDAKDKEIQDLIDTPIVVSPIAPSINLDIINSEIQEIGELATVEYLFTDAAKFSDSKQIKEWNIPFTEKSFIIKWDGVIKAGVQVGQIQISLEETEKKIIISMPSAEILSYSIDQDSVEVLDEKDNVFNNISVTDKVKLDAKTEEAMKQRAIENGLLEKASKNAETIISNLLKANPAVTEDYTIEFQPLLAGN